MKRYTIVLIMALTLLWSTVLIAQSYKIVDTDQETCYGNASAITPPQPGEAFYGQDARYQGVQPSYRDNGDGTVTDLNTGLMWQQDLPDAKYNYAQSAVYADGTITDRATRLMWDRNGSAAGMNWEEALAWVQEKNAGNYLGYDDWRLPGAKELHSIVDYNRSPTQTNSAAIDPLFSVSTITDEKGDDDYPAYWTSTTHYDGPRPDKAVYICFGEALGYMNGRWLDVHGAGAQRSDPKQGDPDDYPRGFGPQGDAIRIYNHVRPVRNVEGKNPTGIQDAQSDEAGTPSRFQLAQNYPNPFNPSTTISFQIPASSRVTLDVHNTAGQRVQTLIEGHLAPGLHQVEWRAEALPSGLYFCTLKAGSSIATRRMVQLK